MFEATLAKFRPIIAGACYCAVTAFGNQYVLELEAGPHSHIVSSFVESGLPSLSFTIITPYGRIMYYVSGYNLRYLSSASPQVHSFDASHLAMLNTS